MAEQTPSGFTSVSRDTSDLYNLTMNKRPTKRNLDIPIADNVNRWRSDKQFTPQDTPKEVKTRNSVDSVSKDPQDVIRNTKVKNYLIDKFKKNKTKPESIPVPLVRPGHHLNTNPLKEFKYSAFDGKQVMR